MNWAIVGFVGGFLAATAVGIVLLTWKWLSARDEAREAERQREALVAAVGKRIARARLELYVANGHLLKFPTAWEAPLKARPCVEKAIEILDGKGRTRATAPRGE